MCFACTSHNKTKTNRQSTQDAGPHCQNGFCCHYWCCPTFQLKCFGVFSIKTRKRTETEQCSICSVFDFVMISVLKQKPKLSLCSFHNSFTCVSRLPVEKSEIWGSLFILFNRDLEKKKYKRNLEVFFCDPLVHPNWWLVICLSVRFRWQIWNLQ